MNGNKIPDLRALDTELRDIPTLTTLYLEANPCQTNDITGYRRKIMLALPQLQQIDATYVAHFDSCCIKADIRLHTDTREEQLDSSILLFALVCWRTSSRILLICTLLYSWGYLNAECGIYVFFAPLGATENCWICIRFSLNFAEIKVQTISRVVPKLYYHTQWWYNSDGQIWLAIPSLVAAHMGQHCVLIRQYWAIHFATKHERRMDPLP